MARIFVVEDNEGLREAVVSYLRLADHEVVEFPRLEGVEQACAVREPDLIVLDVMLPDGDGFLLARRLRKRSQVPLLFLTARSSESDRITGFELGADDYVVKPFSPKELALRVEAVLRRTGAAGALGSAPAPLRRSLKGWVLELDEASHRALLDGGDLKLTPAEWKILQLRATRNGTVITRERLLGESLEYLSAEGSERTVDTHVKNLRAKLGDPGWIETVRGFGYRFAGQPS
jgi:DNA-binding response OmpR family regulator